jgi:hypothetical protein
MTENQFVQIPKRVANPFSDRSSKSYHYFSFTKTQLTVLEKGNKTIKWTLKKKRWSDAKNNINF